ncbi:MAG: NUDIX hydrolase [Dehalococcoidia bacterium]|nr:NUDIX hydrolase [Dehalococcoidia bacterium]
MARWTRLHRDILHTDRWRQVRRDRVRTHTGDEITYTFVAAEAAAFVVPVTDDGQIILIRQYRYPVDAWLWEVPAGMVDAEAPEIAARRELAEEIGAVARTLIPLGRFYTAAAHLVLPCHAFVAFGVVVTHEPVHERTELIERVGLAAREALQMARSGDIQDAASALALLMAEPLVTPALPG